MLATPWASPFDDADWVFELKWDGVRCMLITQDGEIRLESRAGNNMTARYPELTGIRLADGLVLDGEIVALDSAGHPSFELLQGRMNRVPEAGLRPVPVTWAVRCRRPIC